MLRHSYGLAVDAAGNLYIAETNSNRIRKVDTAGVITTVAGTGHAGYSGDNGLATAAALNSPSGVAVDVSGSLYVADTYNHRIRKVDTAGVITTVAGTGSSGYSGDNGPATAAMLNNPYGVAVDSLGNIYIADRENHRIRKVDLAGTITTVVGNGVGMHSGDNGPATAATLNRPCGVAVDAAGNLYIAATDSGRVRKVDTAGVITTVAGTGSSAAEYSGDNGPATAATLNHPSGLAVDSLGNIYIADCYNFRVRKVTAAGVITTVAGNGLFRYGGDGGPATNAWLSGPRGLARDAAGNLYIVDSENQRLRKVTPAGLISTVAGTGVRGYAGDGGAATAALLRDPYGVAVDGVGNVYVSGRNHIRKVDPGGIITTVAGNVTSVTWGYSGDNGPATAAMLHGPVGIVVDLLGNIYIADGENNRIRKVDPGGIITTVAGSGTPGYSGDNGPATAAMLNQPYDVAVDAAGNLYIADASNNRIRKVSPGGIITTVAGSGTAGYSGDNGPATAAMLNWPAGVAVDATGNLYIADRSNQRIRKVDPGGIITTVAGSGTAGYSGDGGPAVAAMLAEPRSVLLDGKGNLYIADDFDNNRIRLVSNSIAQPDFSLLITPASQSAAAGLSTSYTVQITGIGGFTSPVTLAISGLPSSTIYSFSTNPAPPGTSTLTLGTSVSTPLGTAGFTISGTSGSLIRVASATLTTTTAALPATLTIVSGNGQSGPAGMALSNLLAVKVTNSSGNPIAGVMVTFAVTVGGGTLSPASATSDVNGIAQAGWTLGSAPGANTATASVAGLSSITFTATGTQAPAGPGITTVAGSTWVFPPSAMGGPATNAPLGNTRTVAVDGSGNVYVADDGNYMVFRISAAGVLTHVAGNGTQGSSGDKGPATAAMLRHSYGLVVDAAGNLYIAETNSNLIRKVDTAGVITTVAGTRNSGYSGDNGFATAARLNSPSGVAVDAAGNLYIADTYNHRIRKVDTARVITTVAGTGNSGYSGDNGPATAAMLNNPYGVAVDSLGNIYIADRENHRVRKVDLGGVITTVVGNGVAGVSGDNGPATAVGLGSPYGVAVDAAGNLYIAAGGRIRKVDTAGVITTVAGGGSSAALYSGDNGPATAARLNNPFGLAVDSLGNIYIADCMNFRVRKVTTAGVITTVAGNGLFRYGGDGGPATNAWLSTPTGMARDAAGNLYIADGNNGRLRKVTPTGLISTVAGTGVPGYGGDGGPATAAMLRGPYGVAVDSIGNVYVSDPNNDRIRKVSPDGIISTVVGTGSRGYSGDNGPATAAMLSDPVGIVVDLLGNIYIADANNNRIRKVSPSGIITTVAGTGTAGYSGDNGPATAAMLNWPHNVAVDSAGNLYIADAYNHRVRKVSPGGIITTVAGTGTAGYSGDNGPATTAMLNEPPGVAVDSAGCIYIADRRNERIRKVTAGGIITTIAGTGQRGFSGDGGPAVAAMLADPRYVLVDVAGNLYIADDFENDRIRLVSNLPPQDTSPPIIQPTATSAPNAEGWNNSNVTVSWSASDPESGIAASSGCETTAFTSETAGTVLTCSAVDGAGLSRSVSVTVKIDKTPPTIQITSPANRGVYLRNQAVASNYSCGDALSGIAACSGPVLSGSNFDTSTLGLKTFGVVARDLAGNASAGSGTYRVIGDQVPPLGPASIWIGLTNSDDVGIRFDLRAEVYRNGTQLMGSGELASVPGGSSGFNNAHEYSIPLVPVLVESFVRGDVLSITLWVRNACSGSGKNSGRARLWYGDATASSRFDAAIAGPETNSLLAGSVLSVTAGSGPRQTIDVAAGAKCSPFKPFGTWSRTLP
jgi:sugar lactone lactonase YvrE